MIIFTELIRKSTTLVRQTNKQHKITIFWSIQQKYLNDKFVLDKYKCDFIDPNLQLK